MGFNLVRVRFSGGGRPVLQIMVERIDERPIDVDDCAEVSRTVSALLDVEDPIPGAYTLEISSPGIDRPLVRLDDFDRFAGHEAKIVMAGTIAGRKRFRGRLLGVRDGFVLLRLDEAGDDDVTHLPFEGIASAKLVLTDALMAAKSAKADA